MGKYKVTFSCGHTEEVELFGKIKERERKIEYWTENGLCSACYLEQKNIKASIGCEEVEMSYKKYKEEYPNCKTKKGSWNPTTKSIIVYIPKQE